MNGQQAGPSYRLCLVGDPHSKSEEAIMQVLGNLSQDEDERRSERRISTESEDMFAEYEEEEVFENQPNHTSIAENVTFQTSQLEDPLALEDRPSSSCCLSQRSYTGDENEDLRIENTVEKPKSKPTSVSSKGGRKWNPIWDGFQTLKDGHGKITSNKCKDCGQKVSPQAQRMTAHKSKCNKSKIEKQLSITKFAPESSIKDAPEPILEETPDFEELSGATKSSSVSTGSIISSLGSSKKQTKIHTFFKALTSQEKSSIDYKLGKFLFSSNLSFNVLENPRFFDFINALNPAYSIPSHEVMGSSILNGVYEEIISTMKIELSGSKGVLLQDGWSTNQNDPVISHCLSTGKKTYFLMSENPGIESKTGEFCYALLEKAIKKSKEEFKCDVVGIVTDNCSTMLMMQALVRRNYPGLITYGCNSHLMNLLGEKFTSSELKKKVNTVQVFMRTHHFTTAALKEMNALRPLLPGCTRWNSQIDSFINYTQNHSKYLEVTRKMKGEDELGQRKQPIFYVEKKKQLDGNLKKKLDEVYSILNDSTVYPELVTAIKTLRPICESLDELQGSMSTVADATKNWLRLSADLPAEVVCSDYFKKQKRLGLTAPAIAAYLLHPRYRGKGLPVQERESGLNWLANKNPLYVLYASEMNNPDTEYFYKAFLNSDVCLKIDPAQWWKAASTNAVPKEFINLTGSLFVLPASAASIERCFSTLGNIMTKQRNRLSLEKASKLCTINNYLKIQINEQEISTTSTNKRKRNYPSDE